MSQLFEDEKPKVSYFFRILAFSLICCLSYGWGRLSYWYSSFFVGRQMALSSVAANHRIKVKLTRIYIPDLKLIGGKQ